MGDKLDKEKGCAIQDGIQEFLGQSSTSRDQIVLTLCKALSIADVVQGSVNSADVVQGSVKCPTSTKNMGDKLDKVKGCAIKYLELPPVLTAIGYAILGIMSKQSACVRHLQLLVLQTINASTGPVIVVKGKVLWRYLCTRGITLVFSVINPQCEEDVGEEVNGKGGDKNNGDMIYIPKLTKRRRWRVAKERSSDARQG
ncbi:hypothetical protein M405DRAFT_841871 [Rhizopogon salebrosus TDB-379]|nr:hypothetical protein M405DRAFT_841871 [Rhizopogon salebrosus TDB-379]